MGGREFDQGSNLEFEVFQSLKTEEGEYRQGFDRLSRLVFYFDGQKQSRLSLSKGMHLSFSFSMFSLSLERNLFYYLSSKTYS